MISRYSHDVLPNPDGVSRSPRLPPTKLLNLSCDCRCYTMSSKCEGFSEVPVLAISGVVDTSSTSSGDGWTEGRNRFPLRFVTRSRILTRVHGLGCVHGGLNNVRPLCASATTFTSSSSSSFQRHHRLWRSMLQRRSSSRSFTKALATLCQTTRGCEHT